MRFSTSGTFDSSGVCCAARQATANRRISKRVIRVSLMDSPQFRGAAAEGGWPVRPARTTGRSDEHRVVPEIEIEADLQIAQGEQMGHQPASIPLGGYDRERRESHVAAPCKVNARGKTGERINGGAERSLRIARAHRLR